MNQRRRLREAPRLDIRDPASLAGFLQWMASAVVHLDDCMDFTRQEVKGELDAASAAREEIRSMVTDLNATFSAFITAARNEEAGLREQIAKHKAEHELIKVQEQSRKGVWANAYKVVQELLRVGSILVGYGVLRLIERVLS